MYSIYVTQRRHQGIGINQIIKMTLNKCLFLTDFAVGAPYDNDGDGAVYIYQGKTGHFLPKDNQVGENYFSQSKIGWVNRETCFYLCLLSLSVGFTG